jgi:hypothetical protein
MGSRPSTASCISSILTPSASAPATLYRFLKGFHGAMVVGHHLFSDSVDQEESERAWQSWLTRLYAPSAK